MRFLTTIRAIAIVATVSILLTGCQSSGLDGLNATNAPPEISGPAASAIAGDMVSRLAEQIGQGKVTIALKQDNSPFGQALESALKGWGYAVVTDQKTDGKEKLVMLAYVIEPFEGQMLARLSTAVVEIGRAYSVTAAGARPTSPLSVMQRG